MQKYFDLNKHTHFASSRPTKGSNYSLQLLPPKKKRKKKAANQYQIKFYSLVALILLSCFFYVRYQALHVEDSVFHDLYVLLSAHLKKAVHKNLSTGAGGSPSTSSTDEAELVQPLTASPPPASLTTGVFYLPFFDKTANAVRFKERSMRFAAKQNFYLHLISQLIALSTAKDIPYQFWHEGTTVRKAWIENQTLILDFNKYFEVSKYGYKGIEVRLQQILQTVFHNNSNQAIEAVSFLVNGKRKRKLGGHGVALQPFFTKSTLTPKISF